MFTYLLILFALAITIHMVEELIWLPAWSVKAGRWHEPVTTREFSIATAVFLLFLYLIAFFAWRADGPEVGTYLVLGTAVLMLANLIWPHLGATIEQRRYAPGLLSGLLLNLPIMSYLIWYSFNEWDLSLMFFLLGTLLMLFIAIFIWPLLFRIAKKSGF